jgi:hypothetical protein
MYFGSVPRWLPDFNLLIKALKSKNQKNGCAAKR